MLGYLARIPGGAARMLTCPMRLVCTKEIACAGLVLALVVSGPVPAAGQEDAARFDIPGCYTIELGPWDPATPTSARYQIPPDTFRVLTEREDRGWLRRFPDFLQVRPILVPGDEMASAGWQFAGSDSIRVVWTNGFAGVEVVLQVSRDSLHGHAQTFSDVIVVGGPPAPKARLVAHRAVCTS